LYNISFILCNCII